MKISPQNNQINFSGALNNKLLLKGLEGISNHPASFIAGTTLFMASVVRPCSISITPNTDKENKKYLIADSISSGLIKFAITEAVALPVENAIKKINKNPEQFLNSNAVQKLKEQGKTLSQSKNYKFLEQFIKLSTNLITAIPKSVIGVALIPVVMDMLFKNKKEDKKEDNILNSIQNNPLYSKVSNNTSFKGLQGSVVKGVNKIFNNEGVLDFVNKHSLNDTDIARNMSFLTDTVLTGSYIVKTKKSKKIKKENKNPLVYNKLITTAISIFAGYKIDDLFKKASKNLVEKFKEINKNDPKLLKYVQGIDILRPTLAMALFHYGILPIFSTFFSDKINNHKEK